MYSYCAIVADEFGTVAAQTGDERGDVVDSERMRGKKRVRRRVSGSALTGGSWNFVGSTRL